MKNHTLAAAALLLFLPQFASAAPKSKAKEAPIALPLKQIIPEMLRLCTMKTASGLGYKVLRAGAGAKPGASSTPIINYIGYLALTGEVFDQNVNVPMPVGGVIPGFGEGMQLTPLGGITRLCIPAALAYGARATGPIPANSDLVFQIEIVKSR